jgi:signal transduction histidine kinase
VQLKSLPWVGVAEDDLCVIFSQLIDNSCKFGSKPDAIVLCEMDPTPDTICAPDGISLRYQDGATGFDANYLGKLFQPFFRGHTSHHTGSGLGLYLCRQFLRRDNGYIEAVATTDDGGLILDLWLPREGQAPAVS